ncbi:MAG: hypothetical protein ABIG11_10470 [bacterium]
MAKLTMAMPSRSEPSILEGDCLPDSRQAGKLNGANAQAASGKLQPKLHCSDRLLRIYYKIFSLIAVKCDNE